MLGIINFAQNYESSLDKIAKLYWHFHTLYDTIFSWISLNRVYCLPMVDDRNHFTTIYALYAFVLTINIIVLPLIAI